MKQKKIKTYVLDTSVIVYDPEIIYIISGAHIIIPQAVLREIDGLKNGHNLASKNARQFSRDLDRLSSYQNLSDGLTNSAGNHIAIIHGSFSVPALSSATDNEVVGSALYLSRDPKLSVILLSNDHNMRIAARSFGVWADSWPDGFDDIDPNEVFEVRSETFMPAGPVVDYLKGDIRSIRSLGGRG